MPDHIHLLASPNDEHTSIDRWISFWKSMLRKKIGVTAGRWQRDFWDRRLRSNQKYNEVWQYILNNPVRKGLVRNAFDWPFKGELYTLE